MTFSASLFQAIDAASTTTLDGYKVDDVSYEANGLVILSYVDGHILHYRFSDQLVEIDWYGETTALDAGGKSHRVRFLVTKRLSEEDL